MSNATVVSARKPMGFFRSLASPIYAIGRIFSAAERAANVVDMYAEQLETETEIALVPALTRLAVSRQTMQANIAAGKLDDATKSND